MKVVIGFVFATAVAATPALAWECGGKSNVVASSQVTTPGDPRADGGDAVNDTDQVIRPHEPRDLRKARASARAFAFGLSMSAT